MEWLFERLTATADQPVLAQGSEVFAYRTLLGRVRAWQRTFADHQIAGRVVSIESDYSLEATAVFLAAAAANNMLVPISADSRAHLTEFLDVAQVEYRVALGSGEPSITSTGSAATHPYYARLRETGCAGLVLFSSGSTGTHKAAVHDLGALLDKFKMRRHCYRTLVFLQLDHIGGINTLLYTLSNGGLVIVPESRMPAVVCAAIAQHRAELLPTSPTFLNLLLLSEEHLRHDLSSLSLITYGTELMPETTLRKVNAAFPNARLLQTYGLSELGILRSQSRSGDSLWVRVGGEGYETKVVDGRLWIRAHSAMLGYLNAPSPFDAEGFFDTGDLVEVDGEWVRFLGRKSEVINVGGNKVFPVEVENTLLELDNVEDVAVHGERNPLTGQSVVAEICLSRPEAPAAFKTRMRQFCHERLAAYKIPVKVHFRESVHSERFKRMRASL
jgi:acyl-CoA synthetase (AMP-forming)/AMP-acid ligase II